MKKMHNSRKFDVLHRTNCRLQHRYSHWSHTVDPGIQRVSSNKSKWKPRRKNAEGVQGVGVTHLYCSYRYNTYNIQRSWPVACGWVTLKTADLQIIQLLVSIQIWTSEMLSLLGIKWFLETRFKVCQFLIMYCLYFLVY